MAGIAGWVALARRAGDEQALGPMLGALAHRGMQGLCGYMDRGQRHQAVLGAALHDRPSRVALVLDGALVNADELRAQLAPRGFKFSGPSDEEVLLRAYQYWDKDAVKQLRGAFAFALWDARKDRLLLARDRFGEKPLFLHEKNGALYFASGAKALLRAGGRRGEGRSLGAMGLPRAPLRAGTANAFCRHTQARAGELRALAVGQAPRGALLDCPGPQSVREQGRARGRGRRTARLPGGGGENAAGERRAALGRPGFGGAARADVRKRRRWRSILAPCTKRSWSRRAS